MTPVIIHLEKHSEGDTWQGIPVIGPVLVNSQRPGEGLTRIEMVFHSESETGPVALRLDSLPGAGTLPVVIVDPVSWEAFVPPVPASLFTLRKGVYPWAMRFHDTAGTGLIFYRGILTVGSPI